MHLRTAYLPDEGAPLVCRFEDQGREIVVEGVVAWRKEREKGGDFGVSFTALDARSVDVLRGLLKPTEPSGADAAEGTEGSRVRLHIEGLGSPMKARVKNLAGKRKVQVGSSLEFLRVGRRLEVEDVEAGGRRAALIDGVEVLINPKTLVPELVVALRYEGATEDTPQPTVTDLREPGAAPQALRLEAARVTTDAASVQADAADPEPSGDQPAAEEDDAVDADGVEADADAGVSASARAARRLGVAAEQAGVVARDASGRAMRWGFSAFQDLGKAMGGMPAKLRAMRQKNAPVKRRSTLPAPEAPPSGEGRRLRPQSGRPEAAPPRRLATKKQIAIGVAATMLFGTAAAMTLHSAGGADKKALPPPAAPATQAPTTAAAPAPALPTGLAAAPAPGAPVTANVPLFGPTPLATVEPAPLGPPPTGTSAAEEAAELAAAKALTPPAAEDEEFVEAVSPRSSSSKKSDERSAKRPEDVAPFGRGRMHLPTISRLRLDAPGGELRGVADANGFTVLVPGRKLMEEGGAIAKRDTRIARLRTTNTPGGAQVRLTFRDGVPPYRVRLRRDFVELLISAPEAKPTKAASKTKSKPAATKKTKK